MTEMVRRFLRQKMGSAGLVVALAVLALFESFGLASRGADQGLMMANWAIFVIAAGSVSREISSGALQMILSRPILRAQYLFGRYLGILASYGLFLLVTCFLALAVVRILVPRATGAAAPLPLDTLVVAAGGAFLTGAMNGAILLFFSTFLPGIADLLGFLLLSLALNLPRMSRAEWLRDAASTARENMLPEVAWSEVLRGQGMWNAETGRWVFALTAYLVLAAFVFSRRELPYGQD
jgi:hypothetical protein